MYGGRPYHVEFVVFLFQPPGKPKVLNCTIESIECEWSKCQGQVDFYKVRYKTDKSDKEEWNYAKTNADESQITITGLMPNTMYIFQVRGVFEDQEGEYGPENDEMQTESLDAYLNKISTRITKSSPSKYQLFVQEMKDARNVTAKTRKLNLGKLIMSQQYFKKNMFRCCCLKQVLM